MTNFGSENTAALFIGSGGPDLSVAAAKYLREIKDHRPNTKNAVDALNVLWSAADIGALLAKNNWVVMTGGYYMGAMGVASKAAYVISEKLDEAPKPVGAVFSEFFPDDPLTIKGKVVPVGSLSERQELYYERANAFFFMGGGGLGTLSEITGAMKDDSMREEIAKFGTNPNGVNLKPRPFIVIDPTGKMQELLKYIFGTYVGKDKALKDEIMSGIFKRMYFFGEKAFTPAGGQDNYPGLVHVSEASRESITQILDVASGKRTEISSVITTFYEILSST